MINVICIYYYMRWLLNIITSVALKNSVNNIVVYWSQFGDEILLHTLVYKILSYKTRIRVFEQSLFSIST